MSKYYSYPTEYYINILLYYRKFWSWLSFTH